MNPDKSVGPNSISTKILKLLKDEISSHISDNYNIFFFYGLPSVLKTEKVISVHEKDSKCDFYNCFLGSLSSNIEKNPTKNIWRHRDEENVGWGIFVDVQHTFHTFDHDFLLALLNTYCCK